MTNVLQNQSSQILRDAALSRGLGLAQLDWDTELEGSTLRVRSQQTARRYVYEVSLGGDIRKANRITMRMCRPMLRLPRPRGIA